jgi:hypothetical protein
MRYRGYNKGKRVIIKEGTLDYFYKIAILIKSLVVMVFLSKNKREEDVLKKVFSANSTRL